MGEPDRWQRRVEEFVLGQIGDSPTRVLEVGCGEGELARTLARVGHSVTVIDPQAPEGPGDPVPTSRRRPQYGREQYGRSAPRGGTLIIVEFAWDRIDEATAEWALRRLPAASTSERPSWLERCCWGWARGGEGESHDHGDHAEAHFAECAGKEGLHDSRQVRA